MLNPTWHPTLETPIRTELECIRFCRNKLGKIVILIDDVRCFRPDLREFADYPSLNFLVEWANANHFEWSIEHDIFIAKSFR